MISLAHNTQNDTRFEDMLKRVSTYGRESVKSATSKPNLAMDTIRGVAEGYLVDASSHSLDAIKVEQVFDAYMAARAKEAAKNSTTQGLAEDKENSRKANLSKHNAIAGWANTMGTLGHDAVEEYHAILERRTALIQGNVQVKDVYAAIYAISTAQKRSPLEKLPEDIIDTLIAKTEKGEKDIVEKLRDEYKRVYNLAAKMGDAMMDCESIELARDNIAEAITRAGGDIPSMTKKERDDDKLVSFLMTQGFSKEVATNSVKNRT